MDLTLWSSIWGEGDPFVGRVNVKNDGYVANLRVALRNRHPNSLGDMTQVLW